VITKKTNNFLIKTNKIMEHKMVTIPFDLETAKRIREGKISGRIVTEKGRDRAEIVYEDDLCNTYPLLVVIHSIPVSTDWFSATGKALSSENRLLLEVPEYITFKDGDVLSNEEGDFTFILSGHGRYSTSLYAYINFQGILYIGDGDIDAANKNNIECFTLATLSRIFLPGKYSTIRRFSPDMFSSLGIISTGISLGKKPDLKASKAFPFQVNSKNTLPFLSK
jgi:hypothetical protein